MKGVVKSNPQFGLEILDIPTPKPNDDQVLVKIKYCGICGSDRYIYRWAPVMDSRWRRGLFTLPRVPGHEPSGVIENVGKNVTGLKIGDRVAIDSNSGCGRCYTCRLGLFNVCEGQLSIGSIADGALAEYVVQYANSVYKVPDDMSLQVAAMIQPFGVGLHAVEISSLKPGDNVAIIGPGPVGLYAALSARANGAGEIFIIGLSRNKPRLELAKKIGFSIIESDIEDAVQVIGDATGKRGVDVVYECAGYLSSAIPLLRKGGEIIEAGSPVEGISQEMYAMFTERCLTLKTQTARHPTTWSRAINLISHGVIDLKPLLTHVVPLESALHAFELLEEKDAMKVLVEMP